MRLITDVLREHNKGQAVDLASETLAELVTAVTGTGKAGKLVLTFTVRPNKRATDNVFLTVDIKATKPTEQMSESVFFTDEEGGF